MRKHQNDDLRQHAKKVRQRFRQGFYDMERAATQSKTKLAQASQKSDPKTEELYKRVCVILDSPDDSNPIGKLMDKDYYNSLDSVGKQKYVFELSAKFRELSERYRSQPK